MLNIDIIEKWIEKQGIENIIWCTDLDKTLIEINENPTFLYLDSAVKKAIYDINILTNNKLFIITGRELDIVDQLFNIEKLKVSSEYNNVVRFNSQFKPEIKNFIPIWDNFDKYSEFLIKEIDSNIILRKKPIMRSIHYRNIQPHRKTIIGKKLKTIFTEWIEEYNVRSFNKLVIQDGGEALDIGPYPSCKSLGIIEAINYSAVLSINQITLKKFKPIYFGDAAGDVPAGCIAKAHEGKFVVVGQDKYTKSFGDFFLEDPKEYHQLIFRILSKYISR